MVSTTSTLSRQKTNLLVLAYIAFGTLGLPVSLMGVAWPTLRLEYGLPLDALGLLFFSSTIGYFVSTFIIARLISRFGIGSLMVFSAMLSAAAFVGYALAPSWAIIILMGAIAGFGSGVIDAGLNTYLAAEYNEGQMQWLHACFGLGATLSPLLMTASLSVFASWRPAYLAVAGITAVMAVCFVITLPAWKRPRSLSADASQHDGAELGLMDYRTSLWHTLMRLVTWGSIMLFLLYTGAEFTLGNWTYIVFTEGRGVSPQLAGLWAGGFWATFTLGRILAGAYAHRIRMNTLMEGALALAFVGSLLFWWNPAAWVGVVGVLIVGFAMAPIFPGLVSTTSARVGQSHAANTIGIQISAAGLGGAVLPSLAGWLAARFSLESIPVLLAVSLLASLVLYWIASRAAISEL